ncbi:expansin EXLX1 family cellulose-binding protein [Roseateles sp.]|uniref:expansin EXLX1 family cellulose-binding protein n=1 Tax=Roseateles sp. TaxID=1971397 RepID=UPI00326551CD
MKFSNWIRCAIVAVMTPLLSVGALAQAGYQSTHTGKGTYYGYGGGGNCSLPMPASTTLTAAMNAADYNGSQACGAYIEVTNLNTMQKVVVRIDDQCPGCGVGDVDLSEQAFAKISPLGAGIIPISWTYVSGTSTPAKVYFKEGSSEWWAGIQVREHRNPVASVAYRRTGSGSSYAGLPRESYNYFIASGGMGAGPYDLQITDVFGNVLNVGSVALAVTTEISTGQQFPQVLATGVTGGGSSGSPGTTTTVGATTSLSPINEWNGGYCTNVNVTNPNSSPLTWTVKITIAGTVSSSWNGNLTQSDTQLTATGADWNKTLAAGATTQFGFCANR